MNNIRVAIALGSNLGDRNTHIRHAIDRLRDILTDLRCSSLHETEPLGVRHQPRFLNAVLVGRTALSAKQLLTKLLAIEGERGRMRPYPGAPRTLDLDLILYGEKIIKTPDLQVPHPRFRERTFVLEPLAAIAADWRDPVTGKTVGELLEALKRRDR